MPELGALERVLTRTKRRMRLQRAWASVGYGLLTGLSMAALMRLLSRTQGQVPRVRLELLLVLGSVALAALARALGPVRDREAASLLDRAHHFHDRVQSAVEFVRTAPAQRTRFMEAAVRDAVARAGALAAERAVVFTRPRLLAWAVLPVGVWLAAGLWPAPREVRPARATVARAEVLEADDLAAFREELRALSSTAPLTVEASSDARAYNALLERLGTGELSRAEALEALLALERKLMEATSGTSPQDETTLRELAHDLARADETTAKALAELDTKRAAEALEELAKRTKEGELSQAERERLKQALSQQREREQDRNDAKKRAEELEGLLKKKREPPQDPGEKSLFEKQKRELERLRREIEGAQRRHRELARLSRDLSEGAQALSQGEQGRAGEALQRGAEDLRRHAEDKLTREQRKELSRQVQQLREMMQRKGGPKQNRGGEGQASGEKSTRSQRFVLRAQGQDPDRDSAKLVMRMPGPKTQGQGDPGQDGQGQEGKGQGSQKGAQGGSEKQGTEERGAEGQGTESGSESRGGAPGQGQGQRVLELGGAGPAQGELEIPGLQGSRAVPTQGASDEHDPRMRSSPTDLDAAHEDSRLTGTPGKGPTRSQVIYDAADRGFATGSYRRVYTDYRSHAEDVLSREDIPPGYRFYVRRYFQLIRPREPRDTP